MNTFEIPYQQFNCPKCGAPGAVSYGHPTYTCTCRLASPFIPTMLSELDVRRIVRDELGKSEKL